MVLRGACGLSHHFLSSIITLKSSSSRLYVCWVLSSSVQPSPFLRSLRSKFHVGMIASTQHAIPCVHVRHTWGRAAIRCTATHALPSIVLGQLCANTTAAPESGPLRTASDAATLSERGRPRVGTGVWCWRACAEVCFVSTQRTKRGNRFLLDV